MDLLPAAVSLITEAMLVSARWASQRRRLCLEQAVAVADHSRVMELEARVAFLEDGVALRDAHITVLEQRLGKSGTRRPYPLAQRLRILWWAEYFAISRRRLKEMPGVSRSSVHRWLSALRAGKTGRRQSSRRPTNKTPEEIADLIWEMFTQNPTWGRHRIATTLWILGVFVSATAVRDVLRRPRPRQPAFAVAVARKRRRRPVQIVARDPNHTWSVYRTRVYRWGFWPTWVLAAVDHYSRKVTVLSPFYGAEGRWVIEAVRKAFFSHGAPGHIITDRDPLFTSGAFHDTLVEWGVGQRFGAVGRQGPIAATERAILTLKQEWLRRVTVIRGWDHLDRLLDDFLACYNEYRGHMTLAGAVPQGRYSGEQWSRPARPARAVPRHIERRVFADVNIIAYRAAA